MSRNGVRWVEEDVMGMGMERLGRSLLALATATLVSSCRSKPPAEDAAPQAPAAPPACVSNEMLVKFKSTLSAQQVQASLTAAGFQSLEYFAAIDVHRCRIASPADARTTAERYAADPAVEYAEPNYIYKASAVPNDPRFADLWAMQNPNDADIDAVEAWDTQKGSRDVVVAIIDTGVDYNHEDLRDNMWRNPGESGNGKETNGVDDDGNGFIDDVFGWDFASNDNDPMDDNAHGSHVAGTIAATGNNQRGVVGVNWQASIMALKFLDNNGSGEASNAIGAILYAAQNGAQVQNNSWGGGGFSRALQEAIIFARDHNSLFVAAAGNEASDNDRTPTYPANYEVENVLAVAASDRNDQLASFSNFGLRTVALSAPGVGILSSTPGNRYQSFDGTSMATPHASGVAALVLAQYPGLGYRGVMVRLVGRAEVKPAFENNTVSGGRLNAQGALSTEPLVAFVTRLENTADAAGPYRVRAETTDDGGIAAVALVYSVNAGPATTVEMTASAAGVSSGEIPGQALGSVVSYFVTVSDDEGHTRRSRDFEFQIVAPEGGRPCGNFALALPGPTAGGRQLVLGLANLAIVILGILALRRTCVPSRSRVH
jgi:subtilisin family serine protease